MNQRMDALGNRMTCLETKFDNGIRARMENVEKKLDTLAQTQQTVQIEIAKGMGRHALLSVMFQGIGAGVVVLLMTWLNGGG